MVVCQTPKSPGHVSCLSVQLCPPASHESHVASTQAQVVILSRLPIRFLLQITNLDISGNILSGTLPTAWSSLTQVSLPAAFIWYMLAQQSCCSSHHTPHHASHSCNAALAVEIGNLCVDGLKVLN